MTLPKADWIFFLSPSGVELFAEKFDASTFKIGVIGPGTERAVEEQGWQVSFLPKGTDPKEGIDEFAEMLPSTETVIMACSDKSLKRMHGIVPENQLIEWEFYENVSAPEISKSTADYLIFTSPSNADAYLDLYELGENQVVVAIGKTTDTALEKRGVLNKIRAEHPLEEWIWGAILKSMYI
ncbi:hypothetical protein G3O08_08450 [Cryomorpha ignava]|uniref:Uroporphyrinogen-III synthase n=1 Tax=Cryomorpha ignava TaxID=101383 RepID=A0A7K3WPE4_9FLAO|nr:uroporphyrinogen-III synthase [Cryomorpha ignava]NEN23529.1 hypothetical protein [Cryomorpha ignava]